MQMLSFGLINLQRCWPRERKHSIILEINIYHQFMLIFFPFDNDEMESSKCCVTFLSLTFLLKYHNCSLTILTINVKRPEIQH